MKKIITVFYCLIQLQHLTAQNAYMLKDIFTGTNGSPAGFMPFTYQRMFIKAYSPANGYELWISNGTVNGTTLLKDINPGSADADPEDFFLFNGIMYFLANDGVNGKELWKTDGTTAGTVMVKDMEPGAAGYSNADFFKFNTGLYFVVNTPAYGDEIWKTDGTAAGTSLVKDICPGTCSSFSLTAYPRNGWEFNGNFYFVVNDGTTGYELWKSNGTTAGTTLLKDIWPGINSSSVNYFFNWNNQLFFTADDGTAGNELWKTNGTTAGTVMVKDINPGSNNGTGWSPPSFCDYNGTLLFLAANHDNNSELWRTDGTTTGTYLVKDIRPGIYYGSGISPLIKYNNAGYFTADDSTHGYELWKTDGTAAGTVLVKDIRPGGNSSGIPGFTILNNLLVFGADNGTNGYEPWRTDGTTAGTIMIKDIFTGAASSSSDFLKIINNKLFLRSLTNTYGAELWKTDGTAAGTVLVKDIYPGVFNGCCSANPVRGGPYLFFGATDWTPYNNELWKSDGTTAGTTKVQEIYPGSNGCSLQQLLSLGNYLFFLANDSVHGLEPWAFKHSNVSYPLPPQLRSVDSPEKENSLNQITLSANPSGGLFLVEVNSYTKKECHLEIFDVTGKEIFSKKIICDTHTTEQIDLTRYADGMYFLKVISNDGLQTFKLFKI